MNKYSILGLLFLSPALIVFVGCSSEEPHNETIIQGQITVDPELDATGDYSGIELLITDRQAERAYLDTLLHSITDSSGFHFASIQIQQRGMYPVVISRNNNRIGIINIVLAQGDTVKIDAELPELQETAEIQSVENDAYQRYDRLQRNFNRVANYINNVGMSADSVETELVKWSGLFWDFYEDTKGTLASEHSAASSLSLLDGFDNEQMMARVDTLLNRNGSLPAEVRNLAVQYHAETEGLDQALFFLDGLIDSTQQDHEKLEIRKEKITLLYDSARIADAENQLDELRRQYADNNEAMEWAENAGYDLRVLSPGKPFPEFTMQTTDGTEVSSQSLLNSPYLIEITRFDNAVYQNQYDLTAAIHQIYNTYGLEIITVPLSTTNTTLNAFFEQREQRWNIINPESVNNDQITETYNVHRVPTRFLVDSEGKIIKRYVGTEFQNVVQGLQKILNQQETES